MMAVEKPAIESMSNVLFFCVEVVVAETVSKVRCTECVLRFGHERGEAGRFAEKNS